MIELARTRDVKELLRDTFGVFFRHAGVFIALSAAVVIPVHVVVEGIGLEMLTGPYDDSLTLAESAVPTIVDFLVVSPLITAICIYALRQIADGSSGPSFVQTFVSGFEAFTPLFFAIVLATLGIAVGFALLVIPGIYLFVRWFFVPQTVVIENARGWQALVRSGEVVQGLWWRTFGLVVLINLAAALPALLVAAPFASIADNTGDAIWALVGTILAGCVTAPIAALYSTLLYYDLLARRMQ